MPHHISASPQNAKIKMVKMRLECRSRVKNQEGIFSITVSPPALRFPELRFTRPSESPDRAQVGSTAPCGMMHTANIAILKDG